MSSIQKIYEDIGAEDEVYQQYIKQETLRGIYIPYGTMATLATL